MRPFSDLLVGISLAALAGCAQARTAADVERSMKEELSHAIAVEDDTLVAMNTELSHAIGTTTVTGALVAGPPMEAADPMPLPGERMPLSVLAPQTWGAPDALDVPETRE
jgi:hypothetical protein